MLRVIEVTASTAHQSHSRGMAALCNSRCHGKLRDELLNREIFTTLEEAKVLIEQWRREYNQVRPHRSEGYSLSAPELECL